MPGFKFEGSNYSVNDYPRPWNNVLNIPHLLESLLNSCGYWTLNKYYLLLPWQNVKFCTSVSVTFQLPHHCSTPPPPTMAECPPPPPTPGKVLNSSGHHHCIYSKIPIIQLSDIHLQIERQKVFSKVEL